MTVLDAGALVGMRRVFSSGAALDRDTTAMLRERLGAAVTEVFGSSEAGGVATRTHRGGDPVWTPLPGVAVASDGDGRMLLHSPWLDPTLRPPVVTDDRITAVDGGFVHHGRSDDVVKVGGRRVALGDVEAKLRAVVGVDDAVAIALPVGGGRGHAIAVAVATVTRTAQDIRAALVPWFDASALPRRIMCVPSLPRESSGKLPRARVLALFGDVELSPMPIHVDVEGAEFEVEIDPALPCFVGHFPGDPILPGAVLLESVVLRSIDIDEVRAGEVKQMKRDGHEPILKHSRWCLLRRPEHLSEKQYIKLADLLEYNLKTTRAYLLEEDLQLLWEQTSAASATKFLTAWITRALRSRIPPVQKFAKTMRNHHAFIMNWFEARGAISSGAVEGQNNKLKVITRRAYGLRTFKATQIALYHSTGALPEPKTAHTFF